MPADVAEIEARAEITDKQVLAELARVLGETFEMVSYRLWGKADPAEAEEVEAAASLLSKARALIRVFEEGPQQVEHDKTLYLHAADGDEWLVSARGWESELHAKAAMLRLEQGGRDG